MDVLESGSALTTVANEVAFRDDIADINGPVRHVEVVCVVTASTVSTATPVTRAVVPQLDQWICVRRVWTCLLHDAICERIHRRTQLSRDVEPPMEVVPVTLRYELSRAA